MSLAHSEQGIFEFITTHFVFVTKRINLLNKDAYIKIND